MDEDAVRAAQVRAEAHGALQFGAALLLIGVILALTLGALALPPAPRLAPLHAALIAAPPVLLGWVVCAFASLRLELLRKLKDGAGPAAAARPRSKIETMKLRANRPGARAAAPRRAA